MKRTILIKIIVPSVCFIIAIIASYHFVPNLLSSRTSIKKFTDTSDGNFENYLNLSGSQPRGTAASSATFLAVGDIMLSRNVAAAIQKEKDPDFPFQKISDVLKSTDFNFANLESPVASSSKDEIIGGHSLIFSSPTTSIQGLKNYNFQILNLANNHAFDQGLTGVKATINTLDSFELLHEGTGSNLEEAWKPAIVKSNGINICFIGASFSSLNDGGKTKNDYVARVEDLDHLKSAIRNSQLYCNFIVVTMHAGTEYTRTPNAAQIKFAHAAVDFGADVVIGAHPHWIQTIERYCPLQSSPPFQGGVAAAGGRGGESYSNKDCTNPKYIFYSLGNFIFDQNFSQETKEGLTLKISLSKSSATSPLAPGAATSDDLQGSRTPAKLESIELIPVIIENSQPRPATAEETKKILAKISEKESILKP